VDPIDREDKIDFVTMVVDLKRWARRSHDRFQKIELPEEVDDLTKEHLIKILREMPPMDVPENLLAKYNRWVQKMFS